MARCRPRPAARLEQPAAGPCRCRWPTAAPPCGPVRAAGSRALQVPMAHCRPRRPHCTAGSIDGRVLNPSSEYCCCCNQHRHTAYGAGCTRHTGGRRGRLHRSALVKHRRRPTVAESTVGRQLYRNQRNKTGKNEIHTGGSKRTWGDLLALKQKWQHDH